MEFGRERELVHLRYELRRLLADGRRDQAAPLLERLRQFAVESEAESPLAPLSAGGSGWGRPLESEIARWSSTFNL